MLQILDAAIAFLEKENLGFKVNGHTRLSVLKNIRAAVSIDDDGNLKVIRDGLLGTYRSAFEFAKDRIFPCSHCDYILHCNSKMKQHISAVHLKEKNFKCTYENCEFNSARAGDLKKHISAVHLKEKNFKCTYENCEFNTATAGNLKRHVKVVHLKEKKYKCTYENCKYIATQACNLKTHISAKHLKKKKKN